VRRSYKFRLRPTARQHTALEGCLESHRELYNAALQERRDGWARSGTRVSYADQAAQLPEVRAVRPDVAAWSYSSQQATLRRLQKAFDNFSAECGTVTSRGIRGSKAVAGSPVWSGRRTVMVLAGALRTAGCISKASGE
jgi:transposase